MLIYLFLAALGLCCCTQAFSSCGVWTSPWGGSSGGGAQALGHTGFSSCSTWAQQFQIPSSRCKLSRLWRMGSAALQHTGSSRIRDQSCVPGLGRQILYHWTIGEAQYWWFFFQKYKQCMSVYLFQPNSPLPYEILVTGDLVISSVSFGPPALPILGVFKGSYSHCLFPSPFPPFLVSSYISKSLLCTLYIARSMFSSI